MIVPLALSYAIAACAPHVGALTMSSVAIYESGGRAFAIGDNTQRTSYFPSDRDSAIDIASRLLRAGHNIDVGYMQINSANFAAFGLDVARAFEPCANVSTGARILEQAYASARRAYGPGQTALVHALSVYNTGTYHSGMRYAFGVYRVAGMLRYERQGVEPGGTR